MSIQVLINRGANAAIAGSASMTAMGILNFTGASITLAGATVTAEGVITEVLIYDFETFSTFNPVVFGGLNTASPQITTSNVTEGTYSFRLTTTGDDVSVSYTMPATLPVGVTQARVDVYVNATGSGIGAYIYNGIGGGGPDATNTVGADTLVYAVSGGQTITFGTATSGGDEIDVYFDNFRLTDSGGTTIQLIESFELYETPDIFSAPAGTYNSTLWDPVIESTTTGNTEGTYAWHFADSSNDSGEFLAVGYMDLTGYSELKLDYTGFASTNTSGVQSTGYAFIFGVNSPAILWGTLESTDSASGTITISLPPDDYSSASLVIGVAGNTEITIDNLRGVP